MKNAVIVLVLMTLLAQCSPSVQIPERALTFPVQYEMVSNEKDTLSFLFQEGELARENILIDPESSVCRLNEDTLHLSMHTRSGYVGGSVELTVVGGVAQVEATKWSCTYQDNYQAVSGQVTFSTKNYKLRDSLDIRIKALLVYNDTVVDYSDTLRLAGVIRVCVRENDFSYQKKNQEYKLEAFFELASGRPDTVKKLFIDDAGLNYIPDEISLFKNLEVLYIGDNSFPESDLNKIRNLTNIQVLDIKHSNLTKFPEVILKFKKLKDLSLHANKITEIPVNIVELKQLEELSLGYIKLSEFPDFLDQLPNLKKVDLSHCGIPDYKLKLYKISTIIQAY
jgi:hypothetical protein